MSLEAAICPACRHSVHSLDTRDGGGGAPVPFAEVQRVRAKNDEAARLATLQIVFAAVPDCREEAQNIVNAAINAYPIPAAVTTPIASNTTNESRGLANAAAAASIPVAKSPALCGLFRFITAGKRALSHSQPPAKSASNSSMSSNVPEISPAASLPLPTPFAPNASVGGRQAQFSVFALPAVAEGAADVRAVAALLRARRPDFVFICAPAQPRRAARAATDWDARLRSVLGAAELPRRSWLLLGATDVRGAREKILPDINSALETCPSREQPSASWRVLSSYAESPRTAVKFGKTAVRYASRARAAEIARGCGHTSITMVEQESATNGGGSMEVAALGSHTESSASGIVRRIGQAFSRSVGERNEDDSTSGRSRV